MADEVIIEEYTKPANGYSSSIAGRLITTQVLDIATLSAAMNVATDYVVVQSKGVGFWLKQGASDVSAAADTNGNLWIPADGRSDPLPISAGNDYIDTAADA